ncbi:MAG: hypothetical protein ACI841_004520 [Planctomycetota bacterium]|jgi:hypothetical protein
MLKLILALALVAIGFLVWTSPSGVSPKTDPSLNDNSKPPTWVAEPNTFYDEEKPELLLLSVSVPVQGGSEIAKRRASSKGMLELAKQNAGTTTEQDGDTTTESLNTTVSGFRELAYWESPDGVMWALVCANR